MTAPPRNDAEAVAGPRVFDPNRQILYSDASERLPGLEVGDFAEESIESVAFGRIAAQTAKQVIVQKVREAERAQVIEAYENRVGEMVTGVVKRLERGSIILDLGGNAEAVVNREEVIPREIVRPGRPASRVSAGGAPGGARSSIVRQPHGAPSSWCACSLSKCPKSPND